MSKTTSYTTKTNENLIGIARRELGDSSRWQEIADLNENAFSGMHRTETYPDGEVIKLPSKH